MNFKPIETLPNACPLFVEDAYKQLVSRLGARAWHWGIPGTASELERFLIRGQSRNRSSDFHKLGCKYHHVFDHCLCFKSKYSLHFVLTLPYGDNFTFYKGFDEFVTNYYADKEHVIYACDSLRLKTYSSEDWKGQLHALPKFEATIVPNWFKVRKNGDFAAIIAMGNQLRWLSERGGFPLVNADGSIR